MSLLRPRTLTPARLEANRRAARLATGPKTAEGKARSRMNSLRHGSRSKLYEELQEALLFVPPGEFDEEAFVKLAPKDTANPSYARLIDGYRRSGAWNSLHEKQEWEDGEESEGRKQEELGAFQPFGIGSENRRRRKKSFERILKPI